MTTPKKESLREKYSRLKKALKKIFRPKDSHPVPQLVLPHPRYRYPDRKNVFGNGE